VAIETVNTRLMVLETRIRLKPEPAACCDARSKLERIGLTRQFFCEIHISSCIAATLVRRSKLNRAVEGGRRL